MEKFVEALKQKIRSKEGLSPKMQDILDACVVLFSTKGFSNTSTKDIAKAANVAEGTIYKHFGTKENLLYATIFPILRDIISTEALAQVQQFRKSAENAPFEQFVEFIVRKDVMMPEEHFQSGKIFISEMMYDKERYKKFIKMIPKDLIEGIYAILDGYKEKNEIVDWPNPVIWQYIMSVLFGNHLTHYVLFTDTKRDKEAEITYLTQQIVKGLKPDKH